MLGRFARAKSAAGNHLREPSTAPSERIYAVGDVHGRYDLLAELLTKIEDHSRTLPEVRTQYVVLLGDLVDRGAQSRSVLKFLYGAQQHANNLVILMGNHEELMLRALRGEKGVFRSWMRIGGDSTLRSFGVEPPSRDSDMNAFALEFARVVPREWLEWMAALPLSARSGDYFFCHAGIRPGVSLKNQKRADMLWIRDEFLDDTNAHGAVIVHGHSIAREVEWRSNRIGIDTGAYATGVLTALYLEGTKREILSTDAPVKTSEPSRVTAP